jgi:hypothetical protein
MSSLHHINQADLLDMLAFYTTQYTQMLAVNNKSDDFYRFKRKIDQLTHELESRKPEYAMPNKLHQQKTGA